MHGTHLASCSKFQILEHASVLDKAKRLANKKLSLKGKTEESTKVDMRRTTDKSNKEQKTMYRCTFLKSQHSGVYKVL